MNLDKINFNSLEIFCNTICNINSLRIDMIKDRYDNNGYNFDDHLEFMCIIGLVSIDDEKVNVSKSLQKHFDTFKTAEFLKELILIHSLKSKSPYVKEIKEYINNFVNNNNDDFIYNPSSDDNIKFSNVRNFLIELEFVEHDIHNNYYVFNKSKYLHISDFLVKKISLKKFKSILAEKDKIGLQAELAIIKYEQNRLKDYPHLQNKIEHVSQDYVSAGYDILSYDIQDENRSKRRHIEVKAVSLHSYEFYISRNEIETARRFCDTYYLYLLPVLGDNKFDFDRMLIVQDPYDKLIQNENDWIKEIESYKFIKK